MMEIGDLKRNPFFKVLPQKDQEFLIKYIEEDGDVEAAVKAVYDLEGLKASRKIRRLQLNPQVGRLLTMIDGEYAPSAKEIVHELWKDFLGSDNLGIRHNNAELLAKLLGYIGKDSKSSAPEKPEQGFLEKLDETTK